MLLLDYSVLLIPIIVYLMYFNTKKNIYIYFLKGYFLLGVLLNVSLKLLFKDNVRPSTTAKCNLIDIPNYDRYGFPSGHAQLMALTATFWSLAVMNCTKCNKYMIIPLWLGMFLVAHSRLQNNCHTKNQVQVGLIVGYIAGFLLFKNSKRTI